MYVEVCLRVWGLCMPIAACIHTYVHACGLVCVCVAVYIYPHVCVGMSTPAEVVYGHGCMYTHVCVCRRPSTCVCSCIHTRACMCRYVYVYIACVRSWLHVYTRMCMPAAFVLCVQLYTHTCVHVEVCLRLRSLCMPMAACIHTYAHA
jgi:hypothetical protein